MLDKTDKIEFNVKNLTSDEAPFHLIGAVNKQNCSYWVHQVVIHTFFTKNYCKIRM